MPLRLVNQVSDKKLKYFLGITEIIAFIIAIILIIAMNSYANVVASRVSSLIVVFIVVLSFFSSMYGPVVGGLTGFLGIVCGYALKDVGITFGEAIAMMIFGVMVGLFASDYKIRDGEFGRKQIALFISMESLASIVSLVFVKPFIEYIFYDIDLYSGLWDGTKNAVIVSIPVNFGIAIILFVVNVFYKNSKS